MNGAGPDVAPLMVLVLILVYAVFFIGLLVLNIVIWWKVFKKTGYGGALGLLMLVPIANIVMLFVLAFGDWPVLRELRALKQQQQAHG